MGDPSCVTSSSDCPQTHQRPGVRLRVVLAEGVVLAEQTTWAELFAT